jgi:hypothetical protein
LIWFSTKITNTTQVSCEENFGIHRKALQDN